MSYEPRLLRHNQNYVNVMVVTKRILRFLQRYFYTDLVESDGYLVNVGDPCGRTFLSALSQLVMQYTSSSMSVYI